MNPIEFISAGAGSGKTYRLTSILAEAMAAGTARAGGIIAMTFTIKAAAELRQRARKALLESGRLDLSTSIGQARIGTVNSVCQQLLQRYCFELGLSPEQTVLSEAQGMHMLRRAIDEVLDPTQREALVHFGDRFCLEDGDWDEPVRFVVYAARANGINAEALRPMGRANAEAMLGNWPAPQVGVDPTAEMTRALAAALASVEAHVDALVAAGQEPQKNTLGALDELRECRKDFVDGTWTWKQWVSLTKLNAGVKLRTTVQSVVDAAGGHERHPEFHNDVKQYLELVFELAASALANYESAKREAGAQDFTDQEMLLLRALHESAAVRESLVEELDLVLVDEFQDTSPIQLAVFVELAKLAKKSVWVGDPKQAIYGFRGTDAGLIASVLEAIPSWGGVLGAPLTSSRRSVPSLVHLVNAVFTPAFPKLQPGAIQLTPIRREHPGQPSLITWALGSRRIDEDFRALGPAVSQLLSSGVQVQDKDTGEWRNATPGDVALLCRFNYQIPLAVDALHQWGLPCVSTRPGLLSTPEAMLVVACLRRMHDPSDTAATALIVSLTDSVPTEVWLDERLRHVQSGAAPGRWRTEGADAHPLVTRLESLRARLAALTPAEALCLAKAESGFCRVGAQWSSSPKEAATRTANVEALLRMATGYEDDCRSSKRPATVAGLLQWLGDQAAAKLDARAAATAGAVEVLTHHSAKGLEWPIVVLTGLDSGARSGLWDVRARTNGKFNAQEPLHGRFIHYWPRPYGRREPAVIKQVQASPLGLEMQAQAMDEHSRLLYVSCTRARDVMVLAVHSRKFATAWTDEIKATQLLFGGEGDISLADGSEVKRLQMAFSEADIAQAPPAKAVLPRWWVATVAPLDRVPLWLKPSATMSGIYSVSAVESVGSRIPLKSKVDMAALGSAIHNAIALHMANHSWPATEEGVAAILRRWRVEAAVEPGAVLAQAQALLEWVKRKWPTSQVHVEVPIEVKLPSGRVVRGQIDLLVGIASGWVLIDHKADPRSTGDDDRLAQAHGSQLDAYAQALAATGREVVEQWLFLPVAAQAARVRVVAAAGVEAFAE